MSEVGLVPVAVAVTTLAALASGVAWSLRLDQPWLQAWAIARAVAQLGLLTLVLRFVIDRIEYVVLFLGVMVVAAAALVAHRLDWRRWDVVRAVGVIAVSTVVPGVVVFGSGAIAFQSNLLLATGGIVVGGVMTISTLFGRSLRERLVAERDDIEAWLALGATPRQAVRGPIRSAGSTAIMPTTDQTRMTGIVVLPGAFVGAVFAGLPVLEAAVFQVVVLASLLSAGAVAIALWSIALGAPRTLARD